MNILILCTGNSCRSQMAHGIVQNINQSWNVRSAGTEPAECVNPKAVEVMKEIGIDIQSHTPHNINEYLDQNWDYVITVCGGANESCPAFNGKVNNRLHIGFDDPSKVIGNDDFIMSEFHRVRNEIYQKMNQLFNGADECLICGKPLEYLVREEEMECAICHKKEMSLTRCIDGHYVCNDCHTRGIDKIIGYCLSKESANPIEILRDLMAMDFCHMHGPEHHILVGASLLTAYKNAGGEIDLSLALPQMFQRAKNVPGGVCGFWGACGAAISSGIFVSIITGSTPLANEPWGMSNLMTSKSLGKIGAIGGPRCCKRNSYLAITSAIEFVKDNLNIEMTIPHIQCTHNNSNNQCIKERCPFWTK